LNLKVALLNRLFRLRKVWLCLFEFEQAKLFSKEEEKTTKKKKKVLCIAGRGKNARLFRLTF